MIVSHLLLILHKKIQFYIFMFEAWNVAKGRKVQGGRILSQGTVYLSFHCSCAFGSLSYSPLVKLFYSNTNAQRKQSAFTFEIRGK